MRRSVSSRPSSATLSKIPGEIVVPAIATRTGWKTCFGFQPRSSTRPRSAPSIAYCVNGSSPASSVRAARGADRLAPCGLVLDRAVVEKAGERPEVGERLDLLAADLDAVVQAC